MECFIYIVCGLGNWINYWLFLIQSGFSSPVEKETFFPENSCTNKNIFQVTLNFVQLLKYEEIFMRIWRNENY